MFTLKRFQYPYTLSLVISIFIVAGAWKLGALDMILRSPTEQAYVEPIPDSELTEQPMEPVIKPVIEESELMEPEEVSPFYAADRTYFDDTLFIGDSRTVGLYEYGNLGNAIVLADSGMSVYKVFKQTFQLASGENVTLEELLSQKQFKKIYIMLGINELGYDFDQTVSVYQNMVAHIEELQPNAVLFLQANLHITGKKSEQSPVYNNNNINHFNLEVQKIADNERRFFLDVNEIFDDEEGNLAVEYTVDESHVLGKYYADWVDWILNHAVNVDTDI